MKQEQLFKIKKDVYRVDFVDTLEEIVKQNDIEFLDLRLDHFNMTNSDELELINKRIYFKRNAIILGYICIDDLEKYKIELKVNNNNTVTVKFNSMGVEEVNIFKSKSND